MPRPSKTIKRSILETKSTENERINEEKQFFKLVLPPDLLEDLENSSKKGLNISSSNINRSTRIKSVKNLPAIEILSSGEDDFFYNKKKSLLEGNSLLVNSNNLSQGHNLSIPKRNKSKILYSAKQETKKEIEMSNEDSDDDPFGFRKAEKRVKKRKEEIFEVTTIDKDNQYNDNVQCEITQSISLDKETNKNDNNYSGDLSEIDKQDQTQENKVSTENEDTEYLETLHKDEEKEMLSSKVKKTPNVTKTADLVSSHLPRRRKIKKKIDFYDSDIEEEVVSLDEEKKGSDYDEKKQLKKRKVGKVWSEKSEKSEKKKTRKIKKENPIWEEELNNEKIKQEYEDRIRLVKDIDSYELLVEEVID